VLDGARHRLIESEANGFRPSGRYECENSGNAARDELAFHFMSPVRDLPEECQQTAALGRVEWLVLANGRLVGGLLGCLVANNP
jgi:hypothetical protein